MPTQKLATPPFSIVETPALEEVMRTSSAAISACGLASKALYISEIADPFLLNRALTTAMRAMRRAFDLNSVGSHALTLIKDPGELETARHYHRCAVGHFQSTKEHLDSILDQIT